MHLQAIANDLITKPEIYERCLPVTTQVFKRQKSE